jgi:hypothetical protein
MAFSRFAYFALTFCLVCCADSTLSAATAVEDKEEKAEWKKLDRLNQYPTCYPDSFVESLENSKQASPSSGLRSLENAPFGRSEKFVYDVGWGPFRAGFVILESAIDPATGHRVMTGKGMTNNFFSALYKVRDYIRTTIDQKGLYPFFFEQHLREGRYNADRWELFDQLGNKVYTHSNDTGWAVVPPFVQNYFSLITYIRTLTFAPGDSFAVDCFVHSKSYNIAVRCVERKPVAVESGTFNCILVKPVLVGEGRVFTKKDEVKLWLTNDNIKMPVMITAKIALGTIIARLIWYERKE